MGRLEDLLVYKKAFDFSMEIFQITKKFPDTEQYSLISQIRRSSRSVCSNLAEAYGKRRYKSHFQSKLSDAQMEITETKTWINFSLSCNYIDLKKKELLYEKADEISRMLTYMIRNPDKYIGDQKKL